MVSASSDLDHIGRLNVSRDREWKSEEAQACLVSLESF